MRLEAGLVLAALSRAYAQSVVGKAYGFATGVTGGGDATAAEPADADELADWLSDSTARVVLINKEYDFTGTSARHSGCSRKSCRVTAGGQLYLGALSCAASDDIVALPSVTYDAAGVQPLKVGSNKSIISSNGKGVLKGKGLSLAVGSSNVIIQGIEFVRINPSVVWGGDALAFQGNNDGVWVDHCKFSLVGRMFIVTNHQPSRLTISNNEFDGTTSTSATCNDNHYWTMMIYGDGDRVTLDRNYFHNLSGRAPKLGDGATKSIIQAVNNYFLNMKGHAFDLHAGASALIEGNVFSRVSQPLTDRAAALGSTVYSVPDSAAASTCRSAIGRTCVVNRATSSGKLPSLGSMGALSVFKTVAASLVKPVDAASVAAAVLAGAGPKNLRPGQSPVATGTRSVPVATGTSSVPVATGTRSMLATGTRLVPVATGTSSMLATGTRLVPVATRTSSMLATGTRLVPVATGTSSMLATGTRLVPVATGTSSMLATGTSLVPVATGTSSVPVATGTSSVPVATTTTTPVKAAPFSTSTCSDPPASTSVPVATGTSSMLATGTSSVPVATTTTTPVKAAPTSIPTSSAPPASTSTCSDPPASTSAPASGGGSRPALYAQCGGPGYAGSTACAQGTCTEMNAWYSQCV